MSQWVETVLLLPVSAKSGDAGVGVVVFSRYLLWLVAMVIAYIVAVSSLDKLACRDNEPKCYTYDDIVFAFTTEQANKVLATWDAKGRLAMTLDAGMHLLGAFLFGTLMSFGAAACRIFYSTRVVSRVGAGFSEAVYLISHIFIYLYIAGHSVVAATMVNQHPTVGRAKASAVIVGIALACVVFAGVVFIITVVMWLISLCTRRPASPAFPASASKSQAVVV